MTHCKFAKVQESFAAASQIPQAKLEEFPVLEALDQLLRLSHPFQTYQLLVLFPGPSKHMQNS
jgi:hypothetical protein